MGGRSFNKPVLTTVAVRGNDVNDPSFRAVHDNIYYTTRRDLPPVWTSRPFKESHISDKGEAVVKGEPQILMNPGFQDCLGMGP